MTGVVWRGLLAHKGRFTLTALAVVLGVAFVVGTLIFTDTLEQTFEELFIGTTEGIDVEVRPAQAFEGQMSDQGGSIEPELLDEVAAIDGVAAVEPEISGFAMLMVDGEPVSTGGAPSIGFNTVEDQSLVNTVIREGRYPEGPGEVTIDAGSASSHDLRLGAQVEVGTLTGGARPFEVVGTFGIGELDSLGGATVMIFDTATATELLSPDGTYQALIIAAEPDVEPDDLVASIAAVVGSDYDVRTGEEAAADLAAEVAEGLGFFTIALLIFAGISLFVGTFIIVNTFSIVVAQRTRELALLRAVGASRRQVLGAVLGEAAVVGVIGSALGVALGIGVAIGLQAVLDAFGIPLPTGALVIAPSTVAIGIALGTVVTTAAATMPARAASRVPPVAALQAVAAPPMRKQGPLRIVVGVGAALLGLGLLAAGLFGGGGLPAVGAGAAVTLIAIALLAALVGRPILVVLGTPLTLLGIRGRLARENAIRNPRRTAATASALMIGLGLVSFAMIFSASLTRSAEALIDDVFTAEFTIRPAGFGFGGFSEEMAERITALDEVAVASPAKITQLREGERTRFVLGVDPETIDEALALGVTEGSIADLDSDGLVLKESAAESAGLALGDTVTVELPRGGPRELTVVAIIGSDIDIDWIVANELVVEGNREAPDNQVWVRLADGVTPDDARGPIEAITADYPGAGLMDQSEQKEQIAEQVNQLLALMTALLVLSVLIALFGIVNTLGLSVYERIREIGLLRALGGSRRQVRAMVRWESVLIAALGSVLGLGVGALFGTLVVRALDDQGITQLVLPGPLLAVGLVVALLAAVVAAVLPARRAARVDVLQALAAD